MAQLEYRLLDAANGYPALYSYRSISKEEIAARCACDYFTKEGVVYEKTSCAVETGLFVIYVKPAQDQQPMTSERRSFSVQGLIVLEIREFVEGNTYFPVIHKFEFDHLTEVMLYIQCNYLTLNGIEWEKTSAEVDEDRKKYVLYVQRSREE